jgi:hypothetical protein
MWKSCGARTGRATICAFSRIEASSSHDPGSLQGLLITMNANTQRYAAPVRALPLFGLLLAYYWGMQFTSGDAVYIFSSDDLYYYYIAPIAAFSLYGIAFVILYFRKVDTAAVLLGLYVAIVAAISIARGDLPTVGAIGLMAVTLFVLYQTRPRVPPALVNVLFLASVVVTTVFYFLGYSVYTAIPGITQNPELWWRISALPHVSSGGFFALFVLFMNICIRGTPLRYTSMGVAGYFVLLSGLRTAVFAGLLAGLYLILRRQGFLQTGKARVIFFLVAATAFVFSVFSTHILAQLPFLNAGFLREVIFRDQGQTAMIGGQLVSAAARIWIIDQHLSLFASNPLFGVGTFNLQALQSGYGLFDDLTTGSEAYLTGLFARVGLPALLLLYVVFFVNKRMSIAETDFATCIRIFLFPAMITYGSFITPYDFVFLLMAAAISGGVATGAGARATPVLARESRAPGAREPAIASGRATA